MKPFSLILLVLGLLKSCNALLCYRCNALNNPTSNCPGWHRRPVDSLRDLQDRGGLYTHCIDIRLANGTVIYQDMTPAMPTCEGNFLSIWKEKLVREYKMDVSTICCEWNRCNGPNAGTSGRKGPEIHFILPLATAVIIWTRNLLAFGS